MNKILIAFVLSVVLYSCVSEKAMERIDKKIYSKPIAAQYSGGHHYYKTLVLYKDGTFLYVSMPDHPGFIRKRRGKYSMDSTSITLGGYGTARVRGNDILLYNEEDEQKKDSAFYRAYNTLELIKR